jgi:hypothetical protein
MVSIRGRGILEKVCPGPRWAAAGALACILSTGAAGAS